MLKAPYIKQPDPMSCALACYAMVAKHFFPQISFSEIAKISDWKPEYVIWSFKFWLWIMDKGITIEEYDVIDYKAWANEGLEGLRKSTSEKEFNYYINNSFDLESYSEDIKKILAHPNFTYHRIKPTFEMLKTAVKNGNICEVVVDARTLQGRDGFSLHRVVVLGADDNFVTFHDPGDKPNVKVAKDLFVKAWLETVTDSELCIYKQA